jgi:hypothetical protein
VPAPSPRASRPRACGAAATSASSGSAACGSRASAGGAGCGSSSPASCSWRPACCPRRTSAGSARAAPRNAPAPGPRSRAAAADEARHAQPLALARRDELVEHHLRAVGEVAELRLPQRQRVRLGQRVAVLEAEHRLFRQHRVDDLVARLALLQMVERRVALLVSWSISTEWRCEKVPRSTSWPDRRTGWPSSSSVPKASASAVAQSMPSPALDHLAAVVEEALDRAVDVEAVRHAVMRSPISAASRLDLDAGLAAARIVVLACRRPQARPAPSSQSALLGL